jgi:hypothetical protein
MRPEVITRHDITFIYAKSPKESQTVMHMTCAWWFGRLETLAYGCNSPHPNGATNMYVTERVPIIIRSATTRGEGRGQPKCVVLRGARRKREWI